MRRGNDCNHNVLDEYEDDCSRNGIADARDNKGALG
jgi:hypothetical protein